MNTAQAAPDQSRDPNARTFDMRRQRIIDRAQQALRLARAIETRSAIVAAADRVLDERLESLRAVGR